MSNRNKAFGLMTGLLILVAVLAVFILRLTYEGIEREKSNAIAQRIAGSLQVGMAKDEAQHLLEDAWREYDCRDLSVYLFGSRDPNVASMLLLRWEEKEGKRVLTKISGLGNEMLTQFDTCRVSEK